MVKGKAMKPAEEERFPNVLRRDDEKHEIFKIAKQNGKNKPGCCLERSVSGMIMVI